jgi:hypothetical protein
MDAVLIDAVPMMLFFFDAARVKIPIALAACYDVFIG